MWAEIFNQPEVQDSQRIRTAMLGELSYELLYSQIISGHHYTNEEKRAFSTATRNAYANMHRVLCLPPGASASAFGACREFLSRFIARGSGRKYIFTLNQDLFVEMYYTTGSSPNIQIPGLSNRRWFLGHNSLAIDSAAATRLPVGKEVVNVQAQFRSDKSMDAVYIKLHGSLMWQANDGTDVMILGTTKAKLISEQPLLRWYLGLFIEALSAQSRILVVIGYGFKDPHINEIIGAAIESSGLRLVVISPEDPQRFKDRVLSSPSENRVNIGEVLWRGLSGYHCGTVCDFYAPTSVQLPERGLRFFRGLGLA